MLRLFRLSLLCGALVLPAFGAGTHPITVKDLLAMVSPKAEAKYVQFQTFNNPEIIMKYFCHRSQAVRCT